VRASQSEILPPPTNASQADPFAVDAFELEYDTSDPRYRELPDLNEPDWYQECMSMLVDKSS
jgi:hypothetical protein